MKWIKVEDQLPELHQISPTWVMSDSVLVLIEGKYPVIARLNHNEAIASKVEWLLDNARGKVTHWMPIELPND